jgi:uncharacterized protein YuzE
MAVGYWLSLQKLKTMNAGSSQATGKKLIKGFVVASSKPPVVEIDTEATAAYVRFGRGKVVRTEPFGGTDSLVMVDYDRQNRILGIELIGAKEFGISYLLRHVPVQIDHAALSRARYVSADLVSKGN